MRTITWQITNHFLPKRLSPLRYIQHSMSLLHGDGSRLFEVLQHGELALNVGGSRSIVPMLYWWRDAVELFWELYVRYRLHNLQQRRLQLQALPEAALDLNAVRFTWNLRKWLRRAKFISFYIGTWLKYLLINIRKKCLYLILSRIRWGDLPLRYGISCFTTPSSIINHLGRALQIDWYTSLFCT